MAVPGMPLPVLLALLFLVALCTPPFESARSALLADILEGDRYAVAISLTNVSLQLAQVMGYLVAGMLVAVLAPTGALLIDGATFAITALWMWRGLQRRPAPLTEAGETRRSLLHDTVEGLRFIARTPRLLAIVSVLWVATLFTYASEGVAAPLVRELDQGTTALGVLLAANPLGVTIGGLVLARLVPPGRRDRAVGPLVLFSLAAVVGAGLVARLGVPGIGTFSAVVALLFVSGLGASWLIPLNVSFVQAVPSAYRGRAFGVAVSGLFGVQGIGILAAGVLAEDLAPSLVVAVSGGLGLLAVAPCLLAYRRTRADGAEADRTEGHMAGDADGAGPSTS